MTLTLLLAAPAIAPQAAHAVARAAPLSDTLSTPAELRSLEESYAFIKLGRFAAAESAATALLVQTDRGRGRSSLAAAQVIEALVEALYRGGKSGEPGTQPLARRGLAIREAAFGPNHPQVARSLNWIASVLSETGDYPASQRVYERALTIMEKSLGPMSPDLATVVNGLGNVHAYSGDLEGARPYFERSLAIVEKARGPDHPDVAKVLNNLGNINTDLGDLAAARPYYERALAIREKTYGPDHPEVAQSLINLGNFLVDAGRFAEARPLLDRALAIHIKARSPEWPYVSAAVNGIERLLFQIGDYAGARALCERGLAIDEKAQGPDNPDVATPLNNLANVLQVMGEYAAARPLYERSLRIREAGLGPDHPDVAESLSNLGALLMAMGDFDESRRDYERAVAIRDKALGPEHPLLGADLGSLAGVLHSLGEDARARELYERSVAVLEKALGPDHTDLATAIMNYGGFLTDRGERAAAELMFARSLGIYQKALGPGHPDVAACLFNQAAMREGGGDHAGAKSLYESALEIREKSLGSGHPLVASSLEPLVNVLAALGDTTAALAAGLRANDISRRHLALTARGLSERQALAYASQSGSELGAVLSIVATHPREPRRAEVLDAVVRSRALVLDEMATRHRAIISSHDTQLLSLNDSLSAARSRLANLFARSPGADVQRDRKLWDQAATEKERLEQKLAERSTAFRDELARRQTGLEQVAASLAPGTALVSLAKYQRIRSRARIEGSSAAISDTLPGYVAFVLRGGEHDPAVTDLGPLDKIDSLVDRWREVVARIPDRAAERIGAEACFAAGDALRKAVWDPIAAQLGGIGRVYIVPEGALNLVSFVALPLSRKTFLAEQGPLIQYVSAERDLALGQRKRGEGLLIVGGVDFDASAAGAEFHPADETMSGSSSSYRGSHSGCLDLAQTHFQPIPATQDEAREVSILWRHLGRSHEPAFYLQGAEATEAAVKREAPGKRVLHLATHGFFIGEYCASAPESQGRFRLGSSENPLLLSGLALAGANFRNASQPAAEDGILTAEEIGALDLGATECVVLSACDTGLGVVRAGEGVFGLRRAFEVAGAETLIMSLWKVDDRATETWMKAFYEARFMRRLGTGEAMRAATLRLITLLRSHGESTHPSRWGAFIAAGRE